MRTAILILALCPFFARAEGPIETRNHRAASLAFLRFDPRGELLAPGRRTLAVSFSSANDLRLDGPVREDYETERLLVRARWGVERGEWTVDVPLLSRGGGFQDPLIDAWHEFVLNIRNLRSDVPYGRSEVSLPGSSRFGSTAGLGDLSVAFARPIGPRSLWTVGAKLPTGNAGGLLGSGAFDVGASAHGWVSLGRSWRLYGSLGFVYQGRPTRLAGARRWVDQQSLAFEWRPNTRDSYVLQWQSEASAVRTGQSFSDGVHSQLSLGFDRRLNTRDSIGLFFSEDGDFLNYRVPALANVAPDFTFGVRWTRRF